MAMTFQSVSPSSKRAITPRTLTCLIWPTVATCSPISMTSIGSSSPRALVSGCCWLGSSQVYIYFNHKSLSVFHLFFDNATKQVRCLSIFYTYLRESTIVPDVTLVGEAVADETKLALLGILLNRVEFIFLADLLNPIIRHKTYPILFFT